MFCICHKRKKYLATFSSSIQIMCNVFLCWFCVAFWTTRIFRMMLTQFISWLVHSAHPNTCLIYPASSFTHRSHVGFFSIAISGLLFLKKISCSLMEECWLQCRIFSPILTYSYVLFGLYFFYFMIVVLIVVWFTNSCLVSLRVSKHLRTHNSDFQDGPIF